MRRRFARPGLALALLTLAGAAGAACAEEAAPPSPTDVGPARTVDVGADLVAAVPEGTHVEPLAELGDPGDGECGYWQGVIGEGDARIELSLNAATCSGEPGESGGAGERVGNGFHGRYVDVSDAPGPRDVESTTVEAGALTTFTQSYFECTNECNDYDDSVALLALDDPPEQGFPTLMLLSPKGGSPPSALAELAATIRVR